MANGLVRNSPRPSGGLAGSYFVNKDALDGFVSRLGVVLNQKVGDWYGHDTEPGGGTHGFLFFVVLYMWGLHPHGTGISVWSIGEEDEWTWNRRQSVLCSDVIHDIYHNTSELDLSIKHFQGIPSLPPFL